MLAATSAPRIDAKRRAALDPRKKQFAKATYAPEAYPHRLNFYSTPPTADISLEHFEEWAIARLKVLAELEACSFRNRSKEETEEYMKPVLEKWMRMSGNRAKMGVDGEKVLEEERRRDHYSHWTLRLAFAGTADLRSRFVRLESALFALRMREESVEERREFVKGLAMSWETVGAGEKEELREELRAATGLWRDEEEAWFKVEWEKVPELVERRQCLLKRGMAYVHVREQSSMVVSEFTRHLEAGMELAARFLPRMDEDNRLAPILHHLSQSFVAPDAGYTEASSIGDITNPTAASIDSLSQHFPLCMQNLHRELRKNDHLKHYGRLQYTLFLKGIGLNLQECIAFWRMSFKKITDEKFKSEYLYNIRHAYGDVGGDANKRGRGYTPYSCQKLLTEALPSGGQLHGCPYRTYSPDNLIGLLQSVGVNDRTLLQGVREDVRRQRYHIACNRVFEAAHKGSIKKVRDEGLWSASELDTILHPNTYFKRSFLLKNLGRVRSGDLGMDAPNSSGDSRMEE